jgi:hypothetical protein
MIHRQEHSLLHRLAITLCVVVGLLGASVAPAQAASVAPDTWAPKFCTALAQWQTTISTQSEGLTTALEGVDDLETGRTQIAAYLGKMVVASKLAAKQLQRAGSPSTPNGAKIAAKFVAGLRIAAKEFASAKASAAKLPTATVAAFAKQGKKLSVKLSDAGQAVTKSFSGIAKLDKGKKLEGAVKAAPECAFLS